MEFQCNICEKIFKKRCHLKDHINRKFPCKSKTIENNYIDEVSELKIKNEQLKTENEKLKQKVENLSNENKIPQTALDYLTVYQGRLVLTDEWITGIKNDEIKISVFPCNYNSIKPECTDFVKLLDVIIKEFTDKLKQTHNVNIDVIKKKYMKYKMKYLQLKQR